MQDVAQTLWSLAKLRANRPRLLRVLAQQLSSLVQELNPRDLATAVWAFGALQYRPDAYLLQNLASAAQSQFDDFEPQVMGELSILHRLYVTGTARHCILCELWRVG